MSNVLLYSGGMDSYIVDKMFKPDIKLFFKIGTKNNDAEYEFVKDRDDVTIIDLPIAKYEQPEYNYYLPLRNLHFVNIAAHYGDVIYMGTEKLATHKDSNALFMEKASDLLNYLLEEDKTRSSKITMIAPFITMDKTEILAKFVESGGDLDECYKKSVSCYTPIDGHECLNCSSCWSKFTAFYNNGYKFDTETIQRFVTNVFNGIDTATPESIVLACKLRKDIF